VVLEAEEQTLDIEELKSKIVSIIRPFDPEKYFMKGAEKEARR